MRLEVILSGGFTIESFDDFLMFTLISLSWKAVEKEKNNFIVEAYRVK